MLANSVSAGQVIEQQPIEIELFLMAIAKLGAQERFEVVLQFLVIDPQHGKEDETILSFDKDLLIPSVLFQLSRLQVPDGLVGITRVGRELHTTIMRRKDGVAMVWVDTISSLTGEHSPLGEEIGISMF
jgi:hypothetical protein